MDYEFFAPQRIRFGWGCRREVGTIAAGLGKRAFLVSGSRTLVDSGALEQIEQSLRDAGIETVRLTNISREPLVEDVDTAVAALRKQAPQPGDLLLAIGGGSAIDLAKAVSALAKNTEGDSVRDYLEGVGRGFKIRNAPLPLVAMPTTSGTGSEATKNAVISSYDPLFKKSLRSELMVPKVVLVDPELTVGLSPEITAHTGMDAITQLIESYISRRRRPIPRALCLQGLEIALPSLVEAVENGTSQMARENMAHAALLSGMALANSGLGMAHGVAAALGVHCRVPHGLACAAMLPATLRANREVSLADLARLGRIATEREYTSNEAAADAFIEQIEETSARIGIPRKLSQIGVSAEQILDLVNASRGNSMDGNPREISDEELTRILEGML